MEKKPSPGNEGKEDKKRKEKLFEKLEACEEWLKQYKPDQYTAWHATKYEDKSYEQIGEENGWNIEKVRTLVQNGMLNIKKCCEK